MAHSNRKTIRLGFTIAEVILFFIATATAYLSQKSEWTWFFTLSIIAGIIFIILKIAETRPELIDIIIREDLAARLAGSAISQGLVDHFNMQNPEDQERRNRLTRDSIATAGSLWLCANSGASYLDPGVNRHWPSIEARLKEGLDFRVVLLNPFSAEKAFRSKLNLGDENLDSKLNLAVLIKLYNAHPTLDIRFVSYGMHATVFATTEVAFVDPYHVGVIDDRIENRSLCLLAKPTTNRQDKSIYRIFKSHLDTLWRSGLSFEEFIEQSREKDLLQRNLPELKPRQYTR